MFIKLLYISLFTLLPLTAFANNGVVKVVKGKVYLISGKTKLKTPVKLGQKVFSSDTVITNKDSRIKVVMIDGNEINISPDSKVVISKYQFENRGKKKNVLLNVLKGKVRSKVKQKYDGNNNKFQVKTKTAVAGVRGTDFLASYNPQQNSSNIITFEGKVEFGLPGANGKILNPVAVSAGQTVSQVGGSMPSAPTSIPATELASIDTETDAEKAPDSKRLPANDQPESKDKKKEPKKEPQKEQPKNKNSEQQKEQQPKKQVNKDDMKRRSDNGGKVGADKNAPKQQGPRGEARNAPAPKPDHNSPRHPASVPEPSMMIDSDLPTADNNNFIENFPSNDALMPIGSTNPIGEYDRLPICEFCNDVINNKDTYLRIRVQK